MKIDSAVESLSTVQEASIIPIAQEKQAKRRFR
jgi:hypothetical protein